MIDVTILGGGRTGITLARDLSGFGLSVVVVDPVKPCPDSFDGEWIQGFGTISAPNFVAIVDPATGDERRLLSTRAIVFAIGNLNPDLSSRMLGISKLGVDFHTETKNIPADTSGRTKVAGIFAAGKTALCPTPDLAAALLSYCKNQIREKTK